VNSNRVAAAAVLAAAAALFALTFGFEKMPEGLSGGFGAEAFPRLVLGVIAALAVLLFVSAGAGQPQPPIPAMVYYTGASLLAYMALVPVVGMLAAMFVFMVALAYVWGERRAWLIVLIAAAVTLAIWGVFVKGFAVQMPMGLLA
jgi:hypothetical protein